MSNPESCASVYRMICQDKVTSVFQAPAVTELGNPGTIYDFHGQLYVERGGKLERCSADEAIKVRGIIMARAVEEEARERKDKEFRARRAKELGW